MTDTREKFLDFGREYEKFVTKGVKLDPDTTRERGLLGAVGLAGEAGEVVDHLKKLYFHGKPLDREAFVEELGDVLWYYVLLLDTFGISFTEIMTMNIYKLVERYPDKHPNGEALKMLASGELSKETMRRLREGGHTRPSQGGVSLGHRVENDRFGDDLGPAFPTVTVKDSEVEGKSLGEKVGQAAYLAAVPHAAKLPGGLADLNAAQRDGHRVDHEDDKS